MSLPEAAPFDPNAVAQPSAVLFACTYNAIRSPMAEAFLKHYLGHKVFVDSAGVRGGLEIDPMVVEVMGERGVDISRHRPKTFDDLLDDNFDLVVTLSPEAHHRALEATRTTAWDVLFWNTFDPTFVEGNRSARMDAFRQVRDDIDRRIQVRFKIDRSPTI